MERVLILDDDKGRHDKFKRKLIGNEVCHCYTADEAIEALKNNEPYDYIFLDHDLSTEFEKPGKGTGYEVANWIANHPQKTAKKRIMIHSLNNIGAAAMMKRLGDVDIRASYIPFLWEKIEASRLPNE